MPTDQSTTPTTSSSLLPAPPSSSTAPEIGPSLPQMLEDPIVLRATLEKFYERHNPSNVNKVEAFLERYKGREHQLVHDIESKYQLQGISLLDYLPSSSSSSQNPPPSSSSSSSPSLSLSPAHANGNCTSNGFHSSPPRPPSKPNAMGGGNNSRRSSSKSLSSSSLNIAALPIMLLSAFAKPVKADGGTGPGDASSASSSTTSSAAAAPSSSSSSCVRAGSTGSDPSSSTSSSPKRSTAKDEKVIVLETTVKALESNLTAQTCETKALQRKLQERIRQNEALQRNLMTVMDRELATHKRSEQQAKQLTLVEKRLTVIEKEKDAAVAKAQEQERQLQESIKIKDMLQSQVENLLEELGRYVNPVSDEGDRHTSSSSSSSGQHRSKGEEGTVTDHDDDDDDTGHLHTALKASRMELAIASRARMEMQEAMKGLEIEQRRLRQQLEEKNQESAGKSSDLCKSSQGLQNAKEDISKKTTKIVELEMLLLQEGKRRQGVEKELADAKDEIVEAGRARRELEIFCQQFRKDVERAATERVNQAFALSSMSLEEMLSRQSNLVALHEEIQAQETQGLKDEIIQLSKALFESRRDAAHRDKQVVALKLELEKAAKEVKSCRERKEKAAAGEKKGCDNV